MLKQQQPVQEEIIIGKKGEISAIRPMDFNVIYMNVKGFYK